MYQMWKSRTFSSLLLQECDHRAQKEVQIFEWHPRVTVKIMNLRFEENEIFLYFVNFFFFCTQLLPSFLFQMIKLLSNLHTKEPTGIFKASGRLTKLWTHDLRTYFFFRGNSFFSMCIYCVNQVVHIFHPPFPPSSYLTNSGIFTLFISSKV